MSYEFINSTEIVSGLIVQVIADPDPRSPRENDNLGIMLCWHPDYTLGDEQFRSPDDVGGARSMREVAEYIRDELDGVFIIPLYLYDHSGISMTAGARIDGAAPEISGRGVNPWDSYGWDTSAVGFIFTTRKRMDELGVVDEMVTVDDLEIRYLRGTISGTINNVEHQLRAEVREYDDFLTGNVWGYVITKPCSDIGHENNKPELIANCPHSEVIESCWGFIGTAGVLEEAMASVRYLDK